MRLDIFLTEEGNFSSRNQAREGVKRGVVYVNGKQETKPSREVSSTDVIEIKEDLTFVSIGGFKLEKALKEFDFKAENKVFVDVGASTGGFTDCLLKNGAKKIYAVDVGENLLHPSLRHDPSVVVMDNRNARYLDEASFPEKIDGAAVDCSFISLKLILPSVAKFVKNGEVLALIKPQFECGAKALGKSGVLKNDKLRKAVVDDIVSFAKCQGFVLKGVCEAPLREGKNVEYVVYLSRESNS